MEHYIKKNIGKAVLMERLPSRKLTSVTDTFHVYLQDIIIMTKQQQ